MFAGKFFTQGFKIASIAPSSPWLAETMIKGIDFDSLGHLVEVGPGTGPVTAKILQRVRSHAQAVILERDPDFCRLLEKRFPGADIVHGGAKDLPSVLAQRKITKVDHIVSGIALPTFPKEESRMILDAYTAHLKPEGTVRQLTEFPYIFYHFYLNHFRSVRFRCVLLSIPPFAGCYECSNPRRNGKTGK